MVAAPPLEHRPIVAERLRRIGGQSFAFLPHRFLRDGFLQSLCDDELRLYVFLVLAADRDGISFYSHQKLCCCAGLSAPSYLAARDGLRRKDLIAVAGIRVQVLSLPPSPLTLAQSMAHAEQLSACRALLDSLAAHEQK